MGCLKEIGPGMPASRARPPPFSRVSIKAFGGKMAPENGILFFGQHVFRHFCCQNILSLARTTDLEELMRKDFFHPVLIVERQSYEKIFSES